MTLVTAVAGPAARFSPVAVVVDGALVVVFLNDSDKPTLEVVEPGRVVML